MSATRLFLSLKDNISGHAYTAASIQGWDNVYMAVSTTGQPALVVETDDRFGGPQLRAARVSLRSGQQFTTTIDGKDVGKRTYHALICESSEQNDVRNFLILVEAFLASQIGLKITEAELASFFRSMVRLFAVKPSKDLDAERRGLWGELFFMSRIRGYRFWAPYWHSEVTGLFDFSSPGKRIEVKTTIGSQRIHHFSHRQVWGVEGEEIMIASLMLTEDDQGLSLRQLIADCRTSIRGTPDYLKLESAVRHAGMDDGSMDGPRFSVFQAEHGLAWFRAADAPHFRMPEPTGVSETKYKVDLSKASPASNEELNTWLNSWTSAPAQAMSVFQFVARL